jgi:hypothetical protein
MDKYQQYEICKARLARQGLSPEEYTKQLRIIARRLGV